MLPPDPRSCTLPGSARRRCRVAALRAQCRPDGGSGAPQGDATAGGAAPAVAGAEGRMILVRSSYGFTAADNAVARFAEATDGPQQRMFDRSLWDAFPLQLFEA